MSLLRRIKLEHIFDIAAVAFIVTGLVGFGYTLCTMVNIYRCEYHNQCETVPEWAKVKP